MVNQIDPAVLSRKRADAERAWDHIDHDGSGTVSSDEMKALMHSLGEDLDDVAAASMLRELDSNQV